MMYLILVFVLIIVVFFLVFFREKIKEVVVWTHWKKREKSNRSAKRGDSFITKLCKRCHEK